MQSLERMFENAYAIVQNDKKDICIVRLQLYFKNERLEKPNLMLTHEKIPRCLNGTELKMF